MKWKKILSGVGKGVGIAAPIASAFGVPGASTVNQAVMLIHDDKSRPNDQAVELMAAQMQHMALELEAARASLQESREKDEDERVLAPIRTLRN